MTAAISKIPPFVKRECIFAPDFAALTPSRSADCQPGARLSPPAQRDRRDDACELQLTNATREIARLRSMFLRAARCCEQKDEPAEPTCPPPPCDAARARRAYAPPALGEVQRTREELPPHRPAPLKIEQQVTNLGTLVDVLL